MSSGVLYVVRHGQSIYNLQWRFAGWSDIPLTAEGVEQAKATAQLFLGKKIDRIISSPLLRARQTADEICKTLDMRYDIMGSFAERYMGVWEGMGFAEANEKYPNHFDINALKTADFSAPGGEDLIEFCNRVESGLKLLDGSKNNIIVCHGLVSRAINRWFNKLPYDKMHNFLLNNAEIAEFYWQK